jgi:16S rRNA G966 N2-methylase RsmD
MAWLRANADRERAFDLVFCDPPYDAAAAIAEPLANCCRA